MTMTDPFANPTTGFDKFNTLENVGRLAIVWPLEYEKGLTTSYSKQPGDAQSVEMNVLFVTDANNTAYDGTEDNPYEYLELVKVFSGPLVGQFRKAQGKMVLGRLGQRPSQKGNPAWVFNPEDDPAERAKAVKALEWFQAEQARQKAQKGSTSDPFAN